MTFYGDPNYLVILIKYQSTGYNFASVKVCEHKYLNTLVMDRVHGMKCKTSYCCIDSRRFMLFKRGVSQLDGLEKETISGVKDLPMWNIACEYAPLQDYNAIC